MNDFESLLRRHFEDGIEFYIYLGEPRKAKIIEYMPGSNMITLKVEGIDQNLTMQDSSIIVMN